MARWVSKLGVVLMAWGMLEGCGAPLEEENTEASSREPSSASWEEAEALRASCSPDAASTQRLKSSLPPPADHPAGLIPTPDTFVNFQGQLYFVVWFDGNHRALWRSDGTSAGTVAVKDFIAVDSLTPSRSRLFFRAVDAAHGQELWVSDGTPAGTRLLKDLTPGGEGNSVGSMSVLGERLLFTRQAKDPKTSALSSELWTSDGTTSGTVRLLDALPVGAGAFSKLKSGDPLLFFTWNENGVALWKTDGTKAGTARIKDVGAANTGVYSPTLVSGGRAFFSVQGNGGGPTAVWTSDGTKAGTRLLHTYDASSPPTLLGVLGSSLYVANTSPTTQRLAVSRLPVAGGPETPVITLPNEYANQSGALPTVRGISSVEGGRKLYFVVSIDIYDGRETLDAQLWGTDGTAAGTLMLHRPLSLSDFYRSPVYAAADDLVFFSAYQENTTGLEPWVTNGTPGGTRLLKDLVPGTEDSYPGMFFRMGSRVFFTASDTTQGGQLWSTRLRTTCSTSDTP